MKKILSTLLILVCYFGMSSLFYFLIDLSIELSLILGFIVFPVFYYLNQKKALSMMLAGIAGPLLYLSFPDGNIWILGFFHLIPLFVILEREDSYKNIFFYGVFEGLITYLGGFYWLIYTLKIFGHFSWFVATLIFVLYTFAFSLVFPISMVFAKFVKRHYKISTMIIYPVIFTAMDFFVYELFTWHWGNSQQSNFYLFQISDITGIIGVTFILALVSTLIYRIISFFVCSDKRFPVRGTIITIVVLIIVYVYGIWRVNYIETAGKENPSLKVGWVQPDTPLSASGRKFSWVKLFDTINRSTDAILKHGKVDLLVFPESMLPGFRYDRDYPETTIPYKIKEKFKELAVNNNMYIYFNNIHEEDDKKYNSSVLISPKGKKVGIYNKVYLLPFGEYIPLNQYFPEVKKSFPQIGHFDKGTDVVTLDVKGVPFAPQICYEIINPDFTRQFIDAGAEFIVNITNDAWFGDTKASKQHLGLLMMRAVENRVPIVRCTNSGISTFVSAVGNIYGKSYNLKGDLVSDENGYSPLYQICYGYGEILLPKVVTFYTKFGNVFAYVVLIISGFFFMMAIFYRQKSKKLL